MRDKVPFFSLVSRSIKAKTDDNHIESQEKIKTDFRFILLNCDLKRYYCICSLMVVAFFLILFVCFLLAKQQCHTKWKNTFRNFSTRFYIKGKR